MPHVFPHAAHRAAHQKQFVNISFPSIGIDSGQFIGAAYSSFTTCKGHFIAINRKSITAVADGFVCIVDMNLILFNRIDKSIGRTRQNHCAVSVIIKLIEGCSVHIPFSTNGIRRTRTASANQHNNKDQYCQCNTGSHTALSHKLAPSFLSAWSLRIDEIPSSI